VDRERVQVLVDLRREFAGRGEDEGAGDALRLAEAMDEGKAEGGALAAAGHGASENVAAFDRGGQSLLLDGSRILEAEFLDAAEKLGGETIVRKRHGFEGVLTFRVGLRPLIGCGRERKRMRPYRLKKRPETGDLAKNVLARSGS
jgi:hypothetical protein